MQSDHQAMLEVVARHEAAEMAGDLDGVMATLAPQPVYDIFALGMHLEGTDAVRQYYTVLFASGFAGVAVEHRGRWVSDAGVVSEDVAALELSGSFFGVALDGVRRFSLPMVTVLPFEAGRIKGERVYFDRQTFLEGLGVATPPG